MSEPRQKPGKSSQVYETPREFIDAVVSRWGPLTFDLAASEANRKAAPYFDERSDALAQDWDSLTGNLWLNPPFGRVAPWAAKCAGYRGSGRILMLTPASVGSNWFADHVHDRAHVIGLNPRVSFDGVSPFPKDLMLSVFEPQCAARGFSVWRWKP